MNITTTSTAVSAQQAPIVLDIFLPHLLVITSVSLQRTFSVIILSASRRELQVKFDKVYFSPTRQPISSYVYSLRLMDCSEAGYRFN
jgi:hypothetical protein